MALSLLPLSSAGIATRIPSASFVALANPRSRIPSLNFTTGSTSSGTLHCSLFSSPLTTLSSASSSLAGSSLEISLFNKGLTRQRRSSFVVRAGKAALCLTKRNKSRKSLARTHGFRRRMKTTAGRAILKRRRAKGRKVLCTQTNPNRGK